MSGALSHELRRLLDQQIDSFEKLELVIALRRAPGRKLTLSSLEVALRIDRDELRSIAKKLAESGLVSDAADGSVMLVAQSEAGERVLQELVQVYEQDKSELVVAIAETSMDRLRNLAGRAFAEAFVIRKKPGGGS